MDIRKEKFPRIYAFLNGPYPTYGIDGVVYEAAERILEFIRNHQEFKKFNHSMNSEQDVRDMFDGIVDRWIEDEYLNPTEDCGLRWMEKFNILTGEDVNFVIKEEIFNIVKWY